jgi:chorismate mutase/prephenate dehydratase
MKGLKSLRRRVDAIDDGVLNALNERARLVQSIFEQKTRLAKGGAVQAFVPGREAEILRRLAARSKGPFPAESVAPVFREIISGCRSLELLPRISYFGAPGSNTHQAALKCFGSRAEFLPQAGIPGVFEDVDQGRADYGLVPVENSTEGVISHTLDLLSESDLKVCSEVSLPIRNLLLSRGALGSVRRVVSHPQPLAQCRQWLARNLPKARLEAADSTSAAAQRAAADRSGGTAAIASDLAARLYSLKVLVRDIQDRSDNTTRFFVVGRTLAHPTGRDKTSVMLNIRDKVGALAAVLKPFERHKVNLTAIESRPSRRKAWDYYFFVDFHGHQDEAKVKRLLKDLSRQVAQLKVLGSYPAA